MKKISILAVFTLVVSTGFAQQQQLFSLFQFFKQGFNPAYVGSAGMFAGTFDYRTQWVNTEGAPNSFNAGVHGLLSSGRTRLPHHAAGLTFSNDQIGVTQSNVAALQYAYRISLTQKTVLSFGVQASYGQTVNNFGNLEAANEPDPMANGRQKNSNSNIGTGIYMYSSRFFAGLSTPTLLKSSKDLSGNLVGLKNTQHYYLMAGYLFPLTTDFKLRLSGLYKTSVLKNGQLPDVADLNASAIFMDRFLLGFSYRTDNTVLAMTQIQLTRLLNVGYGFDFNTANIGSRAGVSHEIMIGFNVTGSKAAFTTPRFVTYF